MPAFRDDLAEIRPYRPGKPIEEVRRELGLDRIAKLASNECPLPPFPQVEEAVRAGIGELNRYPDNERYELRRAVAAHLGLPGDRLWFGGGSSELILMAALAAGGPGRSAVYAWPGFGLYRIASQVARSERIEVPLDADHRHDLDRMFAAIRADTSVVYVCNPNNPTGTHVAADAVADFVAAVPDRVLVVIDEAYHEYPQAADYGTALPLAIARDNVLVAHTFSKVYGLAGLRVGYMVGAPGVIGELRRVQPPFTVNSLGQAAAVESLRHQGEVARRVERNAAGLKLFHEELGERDIPFADSQANFVYLRASGDAAALRDALLAHGIIIRPAHDGWARVTVGTEAENRAFFAALDAVGA